MASVFSRHPRLGEGPNPDCTIFNYDLIVLLTDKEPILYLFSMGGYIEPFLGGRIEEFDEDELIKALETHNVKSIILPEAFVNGYFPHKKKFFETRVKEMGFYGNKLKIYNQKEQNFYYKEIHTDPDWFWIDRELYNSNIVYHSIGYPTPPTEPDKSFFKQFSFCKQGFACESFFKLYYLKDLNKADMFQQRFELGLKSDDLIFYGNMGTSIRDTVKQSLENSKLKFKYVKYGNENLFDLICTQNKGIGISMDGLVFNTIRDAEFGIYGLPSIKVTRADDFLIEQNNITMFNTRSVTQVQPDLFENANNKLIKQQIEDGYDEYMSNDFNNEDKFYKTIKYHFFIILLQKFANVELFIFDILFGDKLKDFIDELDMEADYSIFETVAKPQYIKHNDIGNMRIDFVNEVISKLGDYFHKEYSKWINIDNDNV
tara:strand:+ start:183 stop:1472 length:1290 start_codon:yes stop_codon:yes gene_type:complete